MKYRYAALLSAAVLIPHFALAGDAEASANEFPRISHSAPARSRAPIAQDLGAVQAVVEFCSKLDPEDKRQFERQGKQAAPKISEDGAEAARRSADYHAAHGFVASVLRGLSAPDAARGCSGIR
jgi:hypothetical protein